MDSLPWMSIYLFIVHTWTHYRQTYNIRRTKSQNLNVSCLIFFLSLPNLHVLILSLPNPLKQSVKSRMAMLQPRPSDQHVHYPLRCLLYQRFGGKNFLCLRIIDAPFVLSLQIEHHVIDLSTTLLVLIVVCTKRMPRLLL